VPTYRLQLSSPATRALRDLPPGVKARITRQLDALQETPRPAGVKVLRGRERFLRLRVGDYRVVYAVDDSVRLVRVVVIGHRREVGSLFPREPQQAQRRGAACREAVLLRSRKALG